MKELISGFISLLKGVCCTYQLKIRNEELPEEWSNWLIMPKETYLETERQGPHPISEIEWIEINPIEIKNPGRMMPIT